MAKRIGRPPLDPERRTASVTIRFPANQLAALYAHARKAQLEVPALLRTVVKQMLEPERKRKG
jgi:hypothetical protein